MKIKMMVLVFAMALVSGSLLGQEVKIREFDQQDKIRKEVKILKGDHLRMLPHELNENMPPPIPDMTKEQEEKMKQIHMDFRKFSLPLKNEIKIKEAQLNALRCGENPDMSAINKLVEEIGAVHVKIAKENEMNHQKIRKMLTDSQRVFFDSQERMPRIEKRIQIEMNKED
jgi:Spy/CpxP family protein refolding chaperone